MLLFSVFITTLVYVYSKAAGIGLSYALLALCISLFTSFWSYYFSDKVVLSLSRAKLASRNEYPVLFGVVEELAAKDNLPVPKVYVMDDPAPNAFATGRDPYHAAVCATTGILQKLNKAELEGVLAHELSHVKNFDIRLMSVVVILVGLITLLADFFMRSLWFRGNDNRDRETPAFFMVLGIILAVVSPIIATLIQLAISRKRELLADSSGVLLTRYPEGLAAALEKISADKNILRTANNATAHLYIANPFKHKDWISNLFNTHPPIEERIKILRSM